MYTEEMERTRISTKRGIVGGAITAFVVFVVLGVGSVGWLWWSLRPIDGVERLRGLPVYPGAAGVVVDDKVAAESWMTFQTSATAEDVYAFYDTQLKEQGWQSAGRPSDGGGSGYMQRDGRFEEVEFAPDSFPWVRIVTSRTPVWLDISTVEQEGNGVPEGKTRVTIELRER